MLNEGNKVDACNQVYTHGCHKKRFCWTAAFVGALVGLGLGFLLNIFSAAIGLSAYSVNDTGAMALAVGGLIGMAIGIIACMFVAGWVAGYLGRPYCGNRKLGVLYGFTAWCLTLLLAALLTGHMGRYVTTYSNFASNPSVVTMTTNDNAPMVSSNAQGDRVVVNSEKAAGALFVIFVLFSLGALAACFGGHYGMECECGDERKMGCR